MNRHLLLAALIPVLVLGSGCSGTEGSLPDSGVGTDGGSDAGACDPATKSDTACCKGGCNYDALAEPICVGGQWQCAPDDASEEECGTAHPFCQLPGPGSSLRPCVDQDAGMCLGCDPGEVCFTQTSCSVLEDGGSQCAQGGSGAGDDRCHRMCGAASPCGGGETCETVTFFGCADFDAPRQLCTD